MEDALRVLIRVSDTQFTITGYGASDDLTGVYTTGRVLRINSSASYVMTVTSSSYNAGTNKTTVNVSATLPTPVSTVEFGVAPEGGTDLPLVSKTLTTPKIITSINDANGNEVIKTPATTSAVNEITVTNSATGNAVQIKATGGDTNIELEIGAKGAKQIKQTSAVYQAPQTYTPSASGTATLDLSLGNDHRITMPAGNITIALSNEQVGQKFLVSITQDSGGSRTVTWFTTIKWAGGSAPTLTTTANKRDTFGFVVTGSGTYDGFIVGQNI